MRKGAGAVLFAGVLVAGYAAWSQLRARERAPRFVVYPAAGGGDDSGAEGVSAADWLNYGKESSSPANPLISWGIDTLFDALGRAGQGGQGVVLPSRPDRAPVTPKRPKPTPSRGGVGARLMGDLQRDFGLTRAQAAGVVGNLHHESGGFEKLQEIKPIVPGSRGGWGYAQWTGPRRRSFEKWVSDRGLDARSYEANYGFLKHELKETWEGRAIPALKRTSTPESAATVFMDTFLRPGIKHTSARQKYARRYY